MSGRRPKLAVIGLDGATWDEMLPLIDAGKLPNIARITNSGARGRLRSTIPPITSTAWTSMYTGVEPRDHGILAMQAYDRERRRWRPVSRSDSRVAPFWKDFNRRGVSVGLLCLPFTFPPEPLDGWMISGIMGTPTYSPAMFSSPELYEQVTARCGKTQLVALNTVHPSRRRETLQQQARWLQDASAYLLEQHPTDIFFVVENYTDHIQHIYLRDRKWEDPAQPGDPVAEAYIHADDLVARVEECVGPDTPIIIMSDHGQMPCRGLINTGRINIGFPPAPSPDFDLIRPLARRTARRMLRSWAAMVAAAIRVMTPSDSFEQLKRKLAQSPVLRRFVRVDSDAGSLLVRWAGAFGEAYWGVDYEENREALANIKAQLIAALKAMRFPDSDQPLFEVHDGLELFGAEGIDVPFAVCFPPPGYVTGPLGPDADVILDNAQSARHFIFTKQGWQGTHQMEGIVAANSAALERIGALPDRISGVVSALRGVLELPETEPEQAAARGGSQPDLSDEDIDAIEGRLRDLGYMG